MRGFSVRIGPPPRTVDLTVEELFTNMVKYSPAGGAQVRIEMAAIDGGVEVALTDSSDGFLRVAEEALGLQVGDVKLRAVQGVGGA